MAPPTTRHLEENYWHSRKEVHVREIHADTWVRYYEVPLYDYSALVPPIAATYSADERQVVARVAQQLGAPGAITCIMAVTYALLANKGWGTGENEGYAETRRVKQETPEAWIYDIYGLALSFTSPGIPRVGQGLDGSTALLGPLCERVRIDEKTYPGLLVVHSRWIEPKPYAG